MISFEDFKKLDLRVAKILSVEEIPGKDKLYILELSVGDLGERKIFAGIKPFYSREQLLGKKIIIASNLAPKKLGALVSEGMLLAVPIPEGKFEVVFVSDSLPEGARLE